MSNLENIKDGDIVKVVGEVYYGDKPFDVDCIGVVQAVYPNRMLINLDEVDGDRKVGCIVKNKYITPMSLLEVANAITGFDFSSKEEFLSYLSDKFKSILENSDDAQEAFDLLDNDYSYYLSTLGCVYSLFDGKNWKINIKEELLDFISLDEFSKEWNEKVNSIEDVESILTHKIMNTMSNVGCDVYNALNLELEDFPNEISNYISIYSNGEGAKIELVDDIL